MTTPFIPLLIAPSRSGIDQSIAIPWLTPEDAWQDLQDCYLYRGVLYKRNGYQWLDSVPHAIDGGAGNNYQNVLSITNGPASIVTTTAPHGLATGDVVRLTDVLGLTTAGGVNINGTRWTIIVTGPTTFTLNNTVAFLGVYTPGTGTLSAMPWPGTTYPGSKILAIASYIDTNNNVKMMVLDTVRASIFDTSALNNCLVPIGYQDQLGGFTNLFWWENYTPNAASKAVIYFTNNIAMWYYDGTTQATGLTSFAPFYDAANFVQTCLMIKALGNRLVLFNTTETLIPTTNFPRRARFCQEEADPTLQAFVGGSWDEVTPGKGGNDDIQGVTYLISLGQIQTNIILASRGTQFGSFVEMRATGDSVVPFIYVPIANSRNINSTFGTVVLDRQITSVGNAGLVTCDGNSAGRYDQKIPEFAIDRIDVAGFDQCFGLRNDPKWQSWLLYPANGSDVNTNILVFNYQDQSWFNYNISMSCLGNFFVQKSDPIWSSFGTDTWLDMGSSTWEDLYQNETLAMVGGDYIGNVWFMDRPEIGGDGADNVRYLDPPSLGREIVMQAVSRQWFPFAKEAVAAQFGMIDLLVDFNPDTVCNLEFSVDNNPPYAYKSFVCFPMTSILYGPIDNITNSNPGRVTAIDHQLMTGQTIYIWGVVGMSIINGTALFVTVIDNDTFSIGIDTTAFPAYISSGLWTTRNISSNPFFTRLWPTQTGTFHQVKLIVGGNDDPFALSAMITHWKRTGRIYKGN